MKLEDISNYKSEIYFLCLNILNDLNSAELVCKKIYMYLCNHNEVLQIEGQNFEKWLYLFILNQCNLYYQKHKINEINEYEDRDFICGDHFTDSMRIPSEFTENNLIHAFHGEFLKLPYKLRVVVLSYYYMHLPPEDICKLENISPNTLYNRLQEANLRLRRALDSYSIEYTDHDTVIPLSLIFQKILKRTVIPKRLLFLEHKKNLRKVAAISIGTFFICFMIMGLYFIIMHFSNKSDPFPQPENSTETGEFRPVLNKLSFYNGYRLFYQYHNNLIIVKDEEGNEVLTLAFDNEGKIESKTKYHPENGETVKQIYNSSGKLIQSITYSSENKIIFDARSEYNEQGNEVKQIILNAENEILEKHAYEYDDHGNKIKERIDYGREEDYEQYVFEYDKRDCLRKKIYTDQNIDGVYSEYTVYEYDGNGEECKMEIYYLHGGQDRRDVIRKYDRIGNVQQTISYRYNGDSSMFCSVSAAVMQQNSGPNLGSGFIHTVLYDENGLPCPGYRYAKSEDGSILIYEHSREKSIGNYYESVYDAGGNETKRIYYNKSGNSDYSVEYCYDEENRKISETHYYLNSLQFTYYYKYENGVLCSITDDDPKQKDYMVYEFDKNGKMNRCTTYDRQEVRAVTTEFVYFPSGRLAGKNIEYMDNAFTLSVKYEYNEDGSQITHTYRNDYYDGTYFCEYNNAGNIITERSDTWSAFAFFYRYEYDEDGLITKRTSYGENGGILSETKYCFHEEKRSTDWTRYDKDGNVIPKSETQYDEAGNITKVTEYDDFGKINRQDEYEYDSTGNLVKWIFRQGENKKFYAEYELMPLSAYNIFSSCEISELICTENEKF